MPPRRWLLHTSSLAAFMLHSFFIKLNTFGTGFLPPYYRPTSVPHTPHRFASTSTSHAGQWRNLGPSPRPGRWHCLMRWTSWGYRAAQSASYQRPQNRCAGWNASNLWRDEGRREGKVPCCPVSLIPGRRTTVRVYTTQGGDSSVSCLLHPRSRKRCSS